MENPIYIALSRQSSQRREMDVIAHNIANSNTPGFKTEKMLFREFLREPEDGEPISLVQDVGLARDMTEGPAKPTGNRFDVMIHGEGFFVVDTPLGERYTRHGRFQLDAESTLVTSDGYPVQGEGGAITIPQDGGPVSIAADGTLTNEDGVIGRLQVVEFEDLEQLSRGANNLYNTEENPQAVVEPNMSQGMIEGSNVQTILELTRMIDVSRSYTGVKSFMDEEDERIKTMIRTLGARGGN